MRGHFLFGKLLRNFVKFALRIRETSQSCKVANQPTT